jgi:hypothetical protein
MNFDHQDDASKALHDMRQAMERSARIISLSGWSGIWAGIVALVGAYIAHQWLQRPGYENVGITLHAGTDHFDSFTTNFIFLGIAIFTVALAGVLFITSRRAARQGKKVWNPASRIMLVQMFFPLFAGSVFVFMFIYYGIGIFVAAACLVFYGLALISASRHTLSDIRYLGMLQVALGCTALFFPGYGLIFWALGFGLLHILYGAIMSGKQ